MNFAKTFCKPGSYIEIAPAGLLVTLQYNKNGLIEKMWDGYDNDEELDRDVVIALKHFIPSTIPLNGGTTFVKGVFYTNQIPYEAEGVVPECYKEAFIKRALRGEFFKFAAGTVESLAANFHGALTIRNWLNLAGFTPLVGVAVPLKFTDVTLEHALSVASSDIVYPYLSGFFIFEGSLCKWQPSNLNQIVVDSVEDKMNTLGYYFSIVTSTSKKRTAFAYSAVAEHSIQAGTSVLYESDSATSVLAVKNNIDGKQRDKLPMTKRCPVCSKIFTIHRGLPTACDDPNCLSRCYPRVQHMLRTLNLPELNYHHYLKAVQDKEILMVTDVLYLPQYKDVKPTVTLAEALNAATPVEVCADPNFFSRFANSCNKSVESALYYLSNPARIVTELSVNSLQCQMFINWIKQPDNLLAVQTLLACVDIKDTLQQFEGAPIFRNRTFIITGKFIRGNYDKIVSILQSYAGNVVDSFDGEIPDCVITGSTYENIDGGIIAQARALNVPIYDEESFFSNYDIDSDIMQNLL